MRKNLTCLLRPDRSDKDQWEQVELLNEIAKPGNYVELTVGKDLIEETIPERFIGYAEWNVCDGGTIARVEYNSKTGAVRLLVPDSTNIEVVTHLDSKIKVVKEKTL